jgi:hypothetical protein
MGTPRKAWLTLMEAVEAVCEPLDAPGDAPRRIRHFWEAGNLRATGIAIGTR